MPQINESAVVRLLVDRFGSSSNLRATDSERILTDHIANIILDAKNNPSFNFEESETLDFTEELDVDVDDADFDDMEVQSLVDDEYGPRSAPYDFNTIKEIVKYWRQVSGGRPLKSMQNRWTKLKQYSTNKMLYEWEKHVEAGGNRYEKLAQIYDHVLSEFRTARDNNFIVHDDDIRRWALLKNKEVKLQGFNASDWWVTTFKRKIRAVSRKITKFVTTNYATSQDDAIFQVANHQLTANALFKDFNPDFIVNTDQAGFNKEQYNKRTLADKGSKHVLATVQSPSALTHSYTIQPLMSMSGKLHRKLFIVLQEVNGVFGPLVTQTMFQAPNLTVACSTSGKVTKAVMKKFNAENLRPFLTGARHVLLHDGYGLFKDDSLYPEFPDPTFLTKLQIPDGQTAHVQPFDVFHFNQRRRVHKIVHKRSLQEELPPLLFQRYNILKLNSLIHHQMCAERYEKMNRYAWIASGYDGLERETFVTPAAYGFTAEIAKSQCHSCDESAFMKCAWSNCGQTLCFNHWYHDYHLCQQE